MEEMDVLLERIEEARTVLNNSVKDMIISEEVLENSRKLDVLLGEYIELTRRMEAKECQ